MHNNKGGYIQGMKVKEQETTMLGVYFASPYTGSLAVIVGSLTYTVLFFVSYLLVVQVFLLWYIFEK